MLSYNNAVQDQLLCPINFPNSHFRIPCMSSHCIIVMFHVTFWKHTYFFGCWKHLPAQPEKKTLENFFVWQVPPPPHSSCPLKVSKKLPSTLFFKIFPGPEKIINQGTNLRKSNIHIPSSKH
jgi:hypothetical protein